MLGNPLNHQQPDLRASCFSSQPWSYQVFFLGVAAFNAYSEPQFNQLVTANFFRKYAIPFSPSLSPAPTFCCFFDFGQCLWKIRLSSESDSPLSLCLVAVSGIFPFFHDTFVFFAITLKLTKNTHKEITLRTGVRVALLGDYLPAFSRALLVDGQRYYLYVPSSISHQLYELISWNKCHHRHQFHRHFHDIHAAPDCLSTGLVFCQRCHDGLPCLPEHKTRSLQRFTDGNVGHGF